MDKEFVKVYYSLKNDILRLAFSYTKNLDDAEDITQEVFIKLYENFDKFNDTTYIKKWCIKVTINKCKNLFLSSWKKKISFMIDENKVYKDTNNYLNIILKSILQLPTKDRLLIFLYYYEGYKIKEIASILKIKEATIKTRLKRARERLQIILKEEI